MLELCDCRDRLLLWPVDLDKQDNLVNDVMWVQYEAPTAMITEPTMHWKHPIHPKKDNFSFRNIEESIAQMTTESAPIGVTIMASTKAYAPKLQSSPHIIMIIPVHHRGYIPVDERQHTRPEGHFLQVVDLHS